MEAAHKIRNFKANEIKFVHGRGGHIGTGTYGVVRLAYHKVHQWLAVKCLKVNVEEKLHDEVGPVQEANNPNVVRVFGVLKSPQVMGMVMEYLPGNCLSDLAFNTEIPISPLLSLRFCRDISNGVAGIHNLQPEKRLTHGDLKLENILLSSNLECKIGDFGSSELAWNTGHNSARDRMERNDFTEIYAAPERLMNPHMKMNTAMDVFSIGMIFYYLLCRELCGMDIYCMLLQQGGRPRMEKINSLKQALQNDLTSLKIIHTIVAQIKKCWAQNPLHRPKILQIRDNLQKELDLYSDTCIFQCVQATLEKYEIAKPILANHNDWIQIEDLDINLQSKDENNVTQDRTESINVFPLSPAAGVRDIEDTTSPKAVLQTFLSSSGDLLTNDFEPNNTTSPKVVCSSNRNAPETRCGLQSSDSASNDTTAPKDVFSSNEYETYTVQQPSGFNCNLTEPKIVFPPNGNERSTRQHHTGFNPNDATAPKVVFPPSEATEEETTRQHPDDQPNDLETALLMTRMTLDITVSNNDCTLSTKRNVWTEINKFCKAATTHIQSHHNQDGRILQSVKTILEKVRNLPFNVRFKSLLEAKLLCFLADCYLHFSEFGEAMVMATQAKSLLDAFTEQSEKLSLFPCCNHIIGRAYIGLGRNKEAEQVIFNAISMTEQSEDFGSTEQKNAALRNLHQLLYTC